MSSDLAGVLVVFQTPYHEDETIDGATLEREIDWIYACGADGIVMAMVSEVLRLSSEERDELASLACRFSNRRGPVVVSVGAESGHTATRHAQHAESVGADAVMAIPPISVSLSHNETMAYYSRIIESVDVPVIVQDASSYVGRPLPIALQAELFRHHGDRVMYKPEAEPVSERLSELMEATDGRARAFEGSGGIALIETHPLGVVGTMPGADLCSGVVALWEALETGDEDRARAIHEPLAALVSQQKGLDGFLAVEKHLLVRQGVFANAVVRGPVGFTLDPQTRREVDRLYDELNRIVDAAR